MDGDVHLVMTSKSFYFQAIILQSVISFYKIKQSVWRNILKILEMKIYHHPFFSTFPF